MNKKVFIVKFSEHQECQKDFALESKIKVVYYDSNDCMTGGSRSNLQGVQ